MIQRPTDQNRQPCLLLCLAGVTTGNRPAERLLTLKQQVSIVQPGSDVGLTHARTLNKKSCIFPSYLTLNHSLCVWHRRWYGAWTGYSAATPGGHRAAEKRLPFWTRWVCLGFTDYSSHSTPCFRDTLFSSITRGRVRDGEESKYVLLWVDSRGGRNREIKWQGGGVR